MHRSPFAFAGLLVVVSLMSATRDASAAVLLTAELPGVQTSQVSGVVTETFDSITAGVYSSLPTTSVGTFVGTVAIPNAHGAGGAGGTGHFFAVGSWSGTSSATLLLNGPQSYFGFWWSAADPANIIDFYSGSTLVATFNPATALGSLTNPGYFGNPSMPGQYTNEKFAYLNVFGTNGTTFDKIVFTDTNISVSGFEADNFSVRAAPVTSTGTPIGGIIVTAPDPVVPEPATLAAFGLLSAGLIGCRRKLAGNNQC